MVLRREEKKGKCAYDFTHGFKEEKKKKVTPNLPLKLPNVLPSFTL